MQLIEIENLIDAMPLPVLVIGADQMIAAVNTPGQTLFGDHILGRHYITVLRQPSLLDTIETVAQTRKAMQGRYLGQDGRRDKGFTVHVAPARDVLVLSFQDNSVTEDADQMRRDFVANVSHELRTPLTALLGFIETLRGNARNDPKATDRFLGIMESEAGRMTHIVDNLLSLSRVEAQERIRPSDLVVLSDIVNRTIAELEPLITASGCRVTFNDSSDGQVIPADDAQLRQVVGNLVENALKYGAQGERVDITLSGPTHEARLRMSGLRLRVQDWGEGIADHHIARLTERFYRVDSHRSRSIGGTGLGLAIVKHIINRHRGRLVVESKAQKGTTVTVILPAE